MRTKKDGSFMCIGALLFLTFFSVIMLTIPGAMAEGAVDTVQINITESCSMSGVVNTAHTKTIQSDHLEEDIGTTNIKIVCNDASGFAVYAIGYTDDEYGKTVLTDSTLGSTSDIATGLATSGNTSSWAMKLTKAGSTYSPIIAGSSEDTYRQTGDTDYSGYAVVPSEYAKVVYRLASTDVGTGASGSNFTTTYRVFVSRAQLAGTYVGQVKYTLVHPNTAPAPMQPLSPSVAPNKTIVYAPNTSDTLGDMSSLPYTSNNNSAALRAASPTAGAIIAFPNSTTTLVAPNFYREGYGFAGWSTEFDAKAAFDAGKTVTIYGPNEPISTNPEDDRGLDVSTGAILYPVWVASSGTLQEFSCASSSLTPASYSSTTGKVSATLNSVTALTDSRDGNVYAVARLADGYCWMIENLRLDANHSADSSLAQGYDTGFIGLPASEDTNFDKNGTANNLYSTGDYRTMPRYNNNNIKFGGKNVSGVDLIASYDATDTDTAQWYSYGNYYSWSAAKATITKYTSYSASDAVSTSICPAGWMLPLGNASTGALDDNEQSSTWRVRGFSYLDRKMGGTGTGISTNSVTGASMSSLWCSFPNNFVYSGRWYGAQAETRDSIGYYWSSSVDSVSNSYYLNLSSTVFRPGTNTSVSFAGFTVRCVAGS